MRRWMTDPRGMCSQHLLGEHVELHMFLGSMRRRIGMQGYLDNNLLQPAAVASRHSELVTEMIARGMNHRSPLSFVDVASACGSLSVKQFGVRIDAGAARAELLRRCPACAAMHAMLDGPKGRGRGQPCPEAGSGS